MVILCDVWSQGGNCGLKATFPEPKGTVALALMGELRKKVPWMLAKIFEP